jgi:hypothetical protein
MAQPRGLECREPSPVFLVQGLKECPHLLFDVRFVLPLKYKSHPWPPGDKDQIL